MITSIKEFKLKLNENHNDVSSSLDDQFKEVAYKGATGGFGLNAKVWVLLLLLTIHLKTIGREDLSNEIKWKISEHANPIDLMKKLYNDIDIKDDFYKERLEQISKLDSSINPYVDTIPGFEW